MIFLWICLIVGVVFYYNWTNRKLFKMSKQFRQIFSLPFIGSTYYFLCKDEDILATIGRLNKSEGGDYHQPIAFWFGGKLSLIFNDPKYIEKIMSSQKFMHKSFFYDFLKRYLGEGLVTGSGPQFKKHRKSIGPLFDSKFNDKCYDIFEKYIEQFMENSMKFCNGEIFDINQLFRPQFLRFIGKVVLGIDYDSETEPDFGHNLERLYGYSFTRLTRPWLYSDAIYKMTSTYRAEEVLRLKFVACMRKTVEQSLHRINTENIIENQFEPIIDQIARIRQDHPDLMDEKVFQDHISTLFVASEDTLPMSAAFCCLMLGMYPEYQEKVAEELKEYFGTVPRNANLDDIEHLSYLDKCIKETLRIQPIAPMITRRTVDECTLDHWTIPKDTGILVPVFYVHRNPQFWENPEHFHPDHFLPENERQRPIYAYIPFSGEIRGCIGKIMANAYLRIFLATFLQKFEVEVDGKLPDVKFRMDISTRPVQGYKVRIKERKWK